MGKPDNSGISTEIDALRQRLRHENAVIDAMQVFGLSYPAPLDTPSSRATSLIARIAASQPIEGKIVLTALSPADRFSVQSRETWFGSARPEIDLDLKQLKLLGPVQVLIGRVETQGRDGLTVYANGRIVLDGEEFARGSPAPDVPKAP